MRQIHNITHVIHIHVGANITYAQASEPTQREREYQLIGAEQSNSASKGEQVDVDDVPV